MSDGGKHVQNASSMIGASRGRQVAEVSKKLFGRRPKRMAFPGGKSRYSFLVDLGDEAWIFAKRDKMADAQMEARVLQSLSSTGVTPAFKAISEQWTVQEYVPGERLPVALDRMDKMADREKLVSQALDALLKIQHEGQTNGLAHALPKIGSDVNWFLNGVEAAKRFAKRIDVTPPKLDEIALAEAMVTERDEFIKYDARPGNVLMDGGRMVWFDWEDCGRGKAVEDLAFVLFDEWMPLDADAEARLIETYLPQFQRSFSTDAAHRHLVLYGTVHMMERMRMCLKYKIRDDGWWDRNACLAGDKVGNTSQEMARLSARILRYADIYPETRGYMDWVNEIRDFFGIPDCDETFQFAQAA